MNEKISPSVLNLIGNTPIVELSSITKGFKGKILAKLEYVNPGFSKKDRVALQTITEAEAAGLLKPSQTIIELTSGNTGTGYAIVCSLKGYHFIAVMSKGNSSERARMMRAFGAEVVIVDQAPNSKPGQVSGEDLALVEKVTKKITIERNAFRADQFQLDGNWRSHYLHTAEEIIDQTDGKIDAFCDFIGSGGSYFGISRRFKEQNEKIKCYIVEPKSAAVLANQPIHDANHKIQGGGYSIQDLKFLTNAQIDGYLQITDEEATNMCRRLAREEGIFAGFSSGANVAAALKLIEAGEEGSIICLICDTGLKYLSTDLWE